MATILKSNDFDYNKVINSDESSTSVVIRRFSSLRWRIFMLFFPILFILVYLRISPPLFVYNHTHADSSTFSPTSESGDHKIAVCLVGGARSFELTGQSIIDNVLSVYPSADMFLHSPLDKNSFKFSLLKTAPKITAIRIFKPELIDEIESVSRVLTSVGSPNGIQGLLQYFNSVEGCLTLIKHHQKENNFTYDWIIRTRVDSYWNAPLDPSNFIPGHYLIPPGSSYGGLNDRFGVGDYTTSAVALSRLSLIPKLDSLGYRHLNSERAFKTQLTTHRVNFKTKRIPFCILTDRRHAFPPGPLGIVVAAVGSGGPLSGAKCWPCTPACEGKCVEERMKVVEKSWSWTNWENGSLKLCNGQNQWEKGWERVFDGVAGRRRAAVREHVRGLTVEECVEDFNEMRRRSVGWDTPPVEEICRLGLEQKD